MGYRVPQKNWQPLTSLSNGAKTTSAGTGSLSKSHIFFCCISTSYSLHLYLYLECTRPNISHSLYHNLVLLCILAVKTPTSWMLQVWLRPGPFLDSPHLWIIVCNNWKYSPKKLAYEKSHVMYLAIQFLIYDTHLLYILVQVHSNCRTFSHVMSSSCENIGPRKITRIKNHDSDFGGNKFKA